jgi:hypothetical protein
MISTFSDMYFSGVPGFQAMLSETDVKLKILTTHISGRQ